MSASALDSKVLVLTEPTAVVSECSKPGQACGKAMSVGEKGRCIPDDPPTKAYELHKWLIRNLKFLVLDCTYLVSDIRAEVSSAASCKKKSIKCAAVVLWVRVST